MLICDVTFQSFLKWLIFQTQKKHNIIVKNCLGVCLIVWDVFRISRNQIEIEKCKNVICFLTFRPHLNALSNLLNMTAKDLRFCELRMQQFVTNSIQLKKRYLSHLKQLSDLL